MVGWVVAGATLAAFAAYCWFVNPLPILLVYLFLQRHFVRGMLAGALKE